MFRARPRMTVTVSPLVSISPSFASAAVAAALVVSASASALPDNNPLNIQWGPSPPPELGPPLSRNATRDLSLLGAQIGAIVGSYLFFIAILGSIVGFVGRRLRANALSGRSLDIEMVKPASRALEASPISANTNSAVSPGTGSTPNFSWPSPTKNTFTMFDERVIQEDKAQRERDMERLYAAVMEQDAAASSSSTVYDSKDHQIPKAKTATTPPKLKSPRLLRALKTPALKFSPEKKDDRTEKSKSGRTPSLVSTSSDKRKGSIRGLPISAPIPTPTFSLHSRAASDQEPLTPRYPHPPPTPPSAPSPSSPSSIPRSPTRRTSTEPAIRSFTPPTRTAKKQTPPPKLKVNPPPSPGQPTSSLPLRSLNAAAIGSNPSANTTRVTVLERAIPSRNGPPRTGASMLTPGTAPYSPYMPFTPVTPITPGLVTKQQRKAREKAEGRRIVTEMAKGDGELWDSGY